ncbi:hypothetical protein Lfu02_78160 [Longispora fulva]|uniref:Putative membrane protein n=1 Tax=Longispora fulva TaxID=619741 RepID=A0A8J7G9R1_9ACTN|nr:YibE/F family protein [Longispora fulva]MBG6136383.1 putative membrane protein [Longispora fulva]GIG63444.1 hypothetical protein Lfu02_78160 [Longispora fulva]
MHAHHQHGPPRPGQRDIRAVTLAIIIPLGAVIAVAMLWLWPFHGHAADVPQGPPRVDGTVTALHRVPCDQAPADQQPPLGAQAGPNGCGTATVRLTAGTATGTDVTVRLPNGPTAPVLAAGDEVVLTVSAGPAYQIQDARRGGQLWALGIAFALAVIAFGRWSGVGALAGLAVTFAVLLLFVVPAILAGKPPLAVAIVGSAAIMLTVLYITHGLHASTSVAVAGTLASLILTGVLSSIAVTAMHLTGVTDDSDSYLATVYHVNMPGLLLAGILIGSLGVLDDVTVTQAATVEELAHANPSYSSRQLYRAATRVGRAHIASVINTIILAYAGASLPLLVLIAAGNQPLGQVLTDQIIAQEVVRSLIGTLGLIAAVPITTGLAAFTARHPLTRPGARSAH